MLARLLRLLQRRPEVRRGQPARFQVRVGVALLEEALLVHVPEQEARDGPRPDPLDLRLPGLLHQPRSPQHVAIVPQTRSRVHQERGRLEPARGPSYSASSEPSHRSTAVSRSPESQRAAPASSSIVPLWLASGASSNVRAASGQRFSSSSASPRQSGWSSFASSSNRPSLSNCRGSSIGPEDADGRGRVQQRAAALSLIRHTAAMDRLRQVPWDALRAGVAVPAIASVLEGVPAEREVDRVLRRTTVL